MIDEGAPDVVSVFMGGGVLTSGGPELADELEAGGYDAIAARLGIDVPGPVQNVTDDPLATPGF